MINKTITVLFASVLLLGITMKGFSQNEPMREGKFEASWESLSQYQAPEWFRNAKFGIWAHWGPQCQPEQGDWYARFMYDEGSREYKWHVENYGHPSVFGFKDVINEWKADKWNPEELVKLYKRAGARYFFAMGNHHDNMDLWDSKYQNWNSTKVGPMRDILGEWAKAAKNNKLPFGVSIHSAHAWTWYETAQRSDTAGAYAGIPYDGKMTIEDGKGKWWEGLDPQELYVQNHELSKGSNKVGTIHSQWDWQNNASIPPQAYFDNFYNRTVDMINKYKPDLLYFDDTGLPFYPINDAGLRVAAHFYNSNMERNGGKLTGVIFGKILTEQQKECLVWDVEKGIPDNIQPKPWQTCTCIGSWHYRRFDYDNNYYKSAKTVVHMLIDIVSKNGNLLLNIPVRGDGSIDEKEVKIVNDIAAWMDVNKEGIFDTRPWVIFGEGPVAETANPLHAQGFNEGKLKNLTAQDIRFTTKGNTLYAHVLAYPADGKVLIKSLSPNSGYYNAKIKKVELLGYGKVDFKHLEEGLQVNLPSKKINDISFVLKISQ